MEFLPFIIDLVFVALVIMNVLDGRKKGFVKMILSFAAIIISWMIAADLSEPVAVWANESFVRSWLTGTIEHAVANSIGSGVDSIVEAIPEYLINAAEVAGISIQNIALQISSTADAAKVAEQIYAAIESPLVISAVRIVSFFILYAIIRWVLEIVIGVVNKVFKLPILKSFNRLLGAVVGALKGFVVIGIITIILMLIAMVMPESGFVQVVQQSTVYQFLAEAVGTIF